MGGWTITVLIEKKGSLLRDREEDIPICLGWEYPHRGGNGRGLAPSRHLFLFRPGMRIPRIVVLRVPPSQAH
jgi:hypothetical protein